MWFPYYAPLLTPAQTKNDTTSQVPLAIFFLPHEASTAPGPTAMKADRAWH